MTATLSKAVFLLAGGLLVGCERSPFSNDPPTPEERAALRVQLLVVFAVNVILTFGFFGQREWRRIAGINYDQVIMHAWDGLPWFVWMIVAPLMFILIRRFPLSRGQLVHSSMGLISGCGLLYLFVANLRFALRILPDLWVAPAARLP